MSATAVTHTHECRDCGGAGWGGENPERYRYCGVEYSDGNCRTCEGSGQVECTDETCDFGAEDDA